MIINGDSIKPTAGDTIGFSSGTSLGVNGNGPLFFPTGVTSNRGSGTIIENLWSLCDGSTHTVLSGTYLIPSVTTQQGLNNSWNDITGSIISYVPPIGTKKVIYRFTFSCYWSTTWTISHYKFVIDGVDVLLSRHNRATSNYLEIRHAFEWVIEIGIPTSVTTGSQLTWTTPKILKMQARDYSDGSYDANLHGTTYWDGTSGNIFNMPIINIMAIS